MPLSPWVLVHLAAVGRVVIGSPSKIRLSTLVSSMILAPSFPAWRSTSSSDSDRTYEMSQTITPPNGLGINTYDIPSAVSQSEANEIHVYRMERSEWSNGCGITGLTRLMFPFAESNCRTWLQEISPLSGCAVLDPDFNTES